LGRKRQRIHQLGWRLEKASMPSAPGSGNLNLFLIGLIPLAILYFNFYARDMTRVVVFLIVMILKIKINKTAEKKYRGYHAKKGHISPVVIYDLFLISICLDNWCWLLHGMRTERTMMCAGHIDSE